MKGFILFARYWPLLTVAIPLSGEAQAGNPYPDYVVIGAFAKHGNAIRFTDDANNSNFPAHFQMNPNRNLYYVYVLTTSDHGVAIAYARKLRRETKYFDTWVYSGPLGKLQAGDKAFAAQDINPITGQRLQDVPSEGSRTAVEKTDPAGDVYVESPGRHVTVASRESTAGTEASPEASRNDPPETQAETSIPKRATVEPLTSEDIVGKNFFFALFRADNHRVVEGEVDAIDFERSRKMATYAANVPVKVMLPAGNSKHVLFVCHVFGYRKLQKEFDPANPSPDLYLDEAGNLAMPFELVRLQKGDIAIMYNVFFFKDAAVMRPESRYEVNNLLGLLLENPGYRIRIHGHTNGNAAGKIIRMGKPDGFYSLTETKDGFGSAKKLSEERALVIKAYLVSSGISADRMEIKAWGGKKPLFDKNSARAVENVRVEIEILSE